ncbi:hypothetical protein [Bacillus coreaensis]
MAARIKQAAIKQRGIKDKKQLTKYTLKAALVPDVLLSLVYVNLGFLQSVAKVLPFASVGLEWITPALVGTANGWLLGTFEKKPVQSHLVETKAS